MIFFLIFCLKLSPLFPFHGKRNESQEFSPSDEITKYLYFCFLLLIHSSNQIAFVFFTLKIRPDSFPKSPTIFSALSNDSQSAVNKFKYYEKTA